MTFADIERLTRQADALRKRIDATYELLRGGMGGGTGESHDPVTLGSGSDPALTLSGQELTLADVLTPTEGDARYAQGVGEGPGIDVTGTSPNQVVGLGGDTILLYDSGGSPVAEFSASDAGLTAALAAMAAGDVVELPDVTISGGPWTVSAGTLRGHSRFGSVLDGQVTLADGTALENLSIIRSEADAGDISCVVGPTSGEAKISNCDISCTNAGAGNGYGITEGDGDIEISESWVYGSTSTTNSTYTSTDVVVSTVGVEVGKYYANAGALPAGWYEIAYDDSAWTSVILRSVPFEPEYQDSQWITVDNDPHPTGSYHLYRRDFTIAVADDISSAVLYALADNYLDYIYLNGTLILPSPAGLNVPVTLNVNPSLFVVGTNTLAFAARELNGTLICFGYRLEVNHGSGRILTSGVRMDPVAGEPTKGDRGVWNIVDYPTRHARDIEDHLFTYHKDPTQPDPGHIEYSDNDITTPPTQEDINGAFGAPYTVEQGFMALIDDGGLGLRQYLCLSDGAKWLFAPLTVAASSLGYAALTRYGIVLAPTAAQEWYAAEPTVMIEDGLWKMWYRCGGWDEDPKVYYATSPDGLTWTHYGTSPVLNNYFCPFVFKDSATYHLYAAKSDWSQIDHYTSTDGIIWALDTAAVITLGAGAAWDNAALGNVFVWKEDTNDWRMIYEAHGAAQWKLGYATSLDGNTWSKSASNPVVTEAGSVGGPWIYKHGVTYYMWTHRAAAGALPSDIARYHSTDLVTWTYDGLMLQRVGADEGEGAAVGQIADPHIVIHNHVMYLYYEGSPDGSAEGSEAAPTNIKLVTGEESLIWE